MLALTAMIALAATPVRIATTGWTFSGVEAAVGDAFTDRFATQLAAEGLSVTTPKDIAGVLGLERQKALLGCGAESSSCLAELAGALGVDAVLTGSVVRVGSSFTVTLRVIAAQNGQGLASASQRLKDEDAVQDWLDLQARELAIKVTHAVHPDSTPPVATATAKKSASFRLLPWIPGVAGVAALITGGVLYGLARANYSRLTGAELFPDPVLINVRAIRAQGETFESAGFSLLAIGGAAIAASVIWLIFDSPAPPVAVGPGPGGGAWVSFSRAFP